MRIISKVLTGSAIAAAALAVSACGSKTETTVDNTTVTELNATDDMGGTMTDNMTTVDGASNMDAGMANDTMTTTTTNETTTMTSNGM